MCVYVCVCVQIASSTLTNAQMCNLCSLHVGYTTTVQNVTLMRTSTTESRDIASFIATKLNRASGSLEVLLPVRGVSAIDGTGLPFDDACAREALFDELESAFVCSDNKQLRKVDAHINEKAFANECVETFMRLWRESGRTLPTRSTTTSVDHPRDVLSPSSRSPSQRNTTGLIVSPTSPDDGQGPRDAALASLRAVVDSGKPIVGAGAGTGISAKFEEKGGADLIVVYNSGKFRMAGYGSLAGLLPFKDGTIRSSFAPPHHHPFFDTRVTIYLARFCFQ